MLIRNLLKLLSNEENGCGMKSDTIVRIVLTVLRNVQAESLDVKPTESQLIVLARLLQR